MTTKGYIVKLGVGSGLVVGAMTVVVLLAATQSWANVPLAERNALIALYNSTGADNWHDSSNWKVGGVLSLLLLMTAAWIVQVRRQKQALQRSEQRLMRQRDELERLTQDLEAYGERVAVNPPIQGSGVTS